MAHVFMNHRVEDFDRWRPMFEADAPRREAAGVAKIAILRDADDPNSVWLVADADPAIVDGMLNDPDMGRLMQEAGVIGPPEVFIA